jgi:hypothetical protein
MTLFCRHRHRIGIFLAAAMFAAAALPGMLAAAQGVRLQAPLCAPDGAKQSKNFVPVANQHDHCQICPLGSNAGAAEPNSRFVVFFLNARATMTVPETAGTSVSKRAELDPLNGRAPPVFC